MPKFRLSFEVVSATNLWKYCDADPTFYKNVTQLIPNSQIPDEDWYKIEKETDNPWEQYNNLRKWDRENREFVRNVVLEKLVGEPKYEVIVNGNCPECKGMGRIKEILPRTDREDETVECSDCGGSGKAEHSITVNESDYL